MPAVPTRDIVAATGVPQALHGGTGLEPAQFATAAGLTAVVTVNEYTHGEGFAEAALVVTSLGDPDGERTEVLADPLGIRPAAWVTLADIEACPASAV
jgi:hypothetical protein